MKLPGAPTRREALVDHLIGFALCALYVLILVKTAKHLGFARDEGFYFHAARDYARWFEQLFREPRLALTREAIDGAWGYNHEHPSLMKSLFGLSWLFFHEKHRWITQESLAFRLPGMVLGGLGLWVTHVFGARVFGRRAGLMAALLLGLIPRVFYHAHLDCFDVPVMTMWVIVLYAYWRSLGGGLGWAILTGVAFGLALETKHNAWFVPFLVVAHYFLTRGGEVRTGASRGSFPLPLALVFMAVLGPVIFIGLWPWMWFDALQTPSHGPGRLSEYVSFHLNHVYYNMEYLGYNYFRPPFPRSYVWGMIVFTVPSITLLLGLVGFAGRVPALGRNVAWLAQAVPLASRVPLLARLRALGEPREGDDPRGTDTLLLLGMLIPILPWLSTKTPIFGGTKHWFPAYPFLALFAGWGFTLVSRRLEAELSGRLRLPWLAPAALGAVLVLPPLAQTAHSHPFGLSNYTPIVGGAPGAADVGLNRQFWGFTTGSLVPFFNAQAPPNASVYIHDTAWESWEMLQRDGWLRRDLRAEWQPSSAQFSIVHHELHMNEVDYQIWTAYQRPDVFHVLTYDGVPIVSVYRHP